MIRRTLASRTMLVTGLLLLAFIVFHILQFTTRTIHPTPLGSATVYANLYIAFQEWWFVAIYVGAVVLLCFHLRHGALERRSRRWAGTSRTATRPSAARRPLIAVGRHGRVRV